MYVFTFTEPLHFKSNRKAITLQGGLKATDRKCKKNVTRRERCGVLRLQNSPILFLTIFRSDSTNNKHFSNVIHLLSNLI